MYPVYERNLPPVVLFCYRFVGKQHEIFDNLRCHITVVRTNLHRMSFLVQHDLTLRKVKVNRTPLMSAVSKDTGKLLHFLKHRHQINVTCRLFLIMVFQNLLDTGVRHTFIDTNHRLTDLMIDYISFGIYCHNAAHCQTVHACIQRTDTIRQTVWKHRDHTVCQIDTGSTMECFSVQCTPLLHVIRHICDMYAQNPVLAIFCPRKRYRIIQILRIFAIDRDHHPLTQILATRHICITDLFRHTLCLIHHFLRKFNRQIIALYD